MSDDEPYENIAGAHAWRPKRRVWPLAAVAVLLVAGAALLVVRELRAPKPLRVLVAVDLDGQWWEGSRPAAIFADRIAARLSKLGFEPVRGGDPDAMRVLERAKSPEEAARSLHAAFVIGGSMSPAVLEHKLPKGAYYEARAEGVIRVQHIEHAAVEAGAVATFGGARERDGALGYLATALADQTLDVALPAVLADASIKELLADRQSNLAPQIYPARDFVLARDKAMNDARDAWKDKIEGRLAKEDGANKPRYLSPPGAHDELAAVVPGGALVSTKGIRPWFPPDTRRLAWFNELETLQLIRAEQPPERRAPGDATTLFRGYNLYGYPHASASGAPAVLVEDLFGWAKTITILDAPGKSRRVRLDPEHRFVDPRMSADGKRVAVYDRPCATCAASLLVIAAGDGRTLVDIDREDGTFGGFAWLDPTHLLFLHTPSGAAPTLDEPHQLVMENEKAAQRQGVFIVDVGVSPAVIGKGRAVPEGQSWAMPAARPGGDLVAFERRDESGSIALLSPADGAISTREVSGAARSPSFSPDGARIVLELVPEGRSTSEIAVIDVAGGAPRLLTSNPYRDRYPLFSTDGSSVFYETLDEDPMYSDRRTLSYIAVVAAPR